MNQSGQSRLGPGHERALLRRTWIIAATSALIFSPSFSFSASAQTDFSRVEIRAIDLGSGIYMMTGAGGNLGVSVGGDGVLLVDDQFAPLSDKIRAAIAAVSSEPVRFVLNTHWHGDHTGGNESFGRAGIPIVAHDRVRDRMSAAHFNSARKRETPPSPPEALPILTFAEGMTFHLNGQTIDVHHVGPAHTDGDSIVHFREADVLHLGDTYFAGTFPYIDLSSGGAIDGAIAAQDRALTLAGPKTRIIPGHGPISNRADLAKTRNMLAAVRDRVRKQIAQGASREEVLTSRPAQSFEGAMKAGFVGPDDFVGFVYESLVSP